MQQTVIGGGYVGLVLAACLAQHYPTHIVDIDGDRIDQLRAGECPIYEPDLQLHLLAGGKSGKLTVGTSHQPTASHVYWLAVGTPQSPGGEADLRALMVAAADLRDHLQGLGKTSAIIVVKSTVPPNTGDRIERLVNSHGASHHVVSCPEFLREGSAVRDFFWPDRVVIGFNDYAYDAGMVVESVLKRVCAKDTRIMTMSRVEAELVKMASNAMLAMRISFANTIAMLADQCGACASNVLDGVGADARIGPDFLRHGLGYGGSCFPKDTESLNYECNARKVEAPLVRATIRTNERMISYASEKLEEALVGLAGKRIAILGAAFKPGTDDTRQSPGIALARWLRHEGAIVVLADPQVSRVDVPVKGTHRKESHMVANSWEGAVRGADAVVLATPWNDFAGIQADDLLAVNPDVKVILDGRGDWHSQGLVYRSRGVRFRSIGAPDRDPLASPPAAQEKPSARLSLVTPLE